MAMPVIRPELIDRVAHRFRVLSDPARLRLITVLMDDTELCVTELMARVGQPQASVSKHLQIMAREGILNRRKDGLRVFYSLADPTLHGVCRLVVDQVMDDSTGEAPGTGREDTGNGPR